MTNSKIGKQYLASKINLQGKQVLPYVEKPISRTRKDIKDWNNAYQLFYAEEPKSYAIQLLYTEILTDALLSSQIQNRMQQMFSLSFDLKNAKGEVDEEQTQLLKTLPSVRQFITAMLESTYYGYSLTESDIIMLAGGRKDLSIKLLPRTNIVPQRGLFYLDYSEDKSIRYRDLPEYGRFVLEFNQGDIGLLNKTVSHVLFKRFAQSCWSELCEIYGIPPRVMKTNTSDPKQLGKATQMMKDMGAAAWFIIDRAEEFEWAQGIDAKGDVYGNLINLCNNEMSLVISGAVMGQDTQNGSRSKDESAQELLRQLIQSDMAMVESWMTNTVLPAYALNGILKPGLVFEYAQTEDTEQLFKFTQGLLPFKNIDDEWIKEKFGIEVTGDRTLGNLAAGEGLHTGSDFFV